MYAAGCFPRSISFFFSQKVYSSSSNIIVYESYGAATGKHPGYSHEQMLQVKNKGNATKSQKNKKNKGERAREKTFFSPTPSPLAALVLLSTSSLYPLHFPPFVYSRAVASSHILHLPLSQKEERNKTISSHKSVGVMVGGKCGDGDEPSPAKLLKNDHYYLEVRNEHFLFFQNRCVEGWVSTVVRHNIPKELYKTHGEDSPKLSPGWKTN